MSRTTIWTCDRCKKSGPGTVHSFDFGNDYSSNHGPEDGSREKKRIIIDLCKECWSLLKAWLSMETPPEKSVCPGRSSWGLAGRLSCEKESGHDGNHCRTIDGYPHEWEGGLEASKVPTVDLFEEALRLTYQVFDITKDVRFHGKNNDQIVLRMPAQSWKDFLVAIDRARKGGA